MITIGTHMKFDAGRGQVEGYAAVFHVVDAQHDVILPGAFRASLARFDATGRLPPMLMSHDVSKPIGVWRVLREDRVGLWAEGSLADTAAGRDAVELMKIGALTGLSIGYRVKRSRQREDGTRELLDLDLVEISPVVFPAQDAARLERVANDVELAAALRRVRDRVVADTMALRGELAAARYETALNRASLALGFDPGRR